MYSGMILIFTPLVIGYLLPFTNKSYLDYVNRITHYLIYFILFLMGLSLAALDNLSSNLQLILKIAMTFFFVIGLANLLVLPILDKYFPVQTESTATKLPFHKMMMESVKLVLVVSLGLAIGLLSLFSLQWVDQTSEAVLLFLLLFIGIQLRNSGLTLKQILINKHGMLIASAIISTSLFGGYITSLLLEIDPFQGMAMASGFGWYSLAGILMGDAYGPVYGGASFILELARELVALALIPMLIQRFPCTSIGYAGATAMDFTLPIIQSTGGIRCVPIAIVSGFILSLLVPVLMLFFVSLSGT
ncbi:lysine exporter LysO family protein [Vibrio penaeicida]|uniref:lysine exporter LysO family protein n=1 Tax=Vibrio penaeicida TaxID=104609 RepID=UPI002736B254|nr:lysine exporter LysO family protein [Vibrio penaeicida]MDP2571305.1 lysine exporter LysO family protein [Vibrio penaeicida]